MTAEFAELQPLIDLLKTFDAAMATEGVDPIRRRRVVNSLLYGNPDGDTTAVLDLEPPYRGPFDPVHPCRRLPTRHCPVVLGAQCGDDACARFDELAPGEAKRLWLPEIPTGALSTTSCPPPFGGGL